MLLHELKSRPLGASRHAFMAAALAATVAFTVGVTASTTASAAGVITQWDFNIDNGFSAFAPGTVIPSDINAALGLPTRLEWGVGGQNSGIDVGSTSPTGPGNFQGSVTTNGAAVNTVTIVHDNNVVPLQTQPLMTATLLDVLTLTPTADQDGPIVGAPPLVFPPLTFNIYFLETINDGSDGNPAGTCNPPSVGGTPCSDIFVIDVEGAGFNEDLQIVQDLTAVIGDGFEYEAVITIANIQELDQTSCLAAGLPAGDLTPDGTCYGLITTESTMNEFQVTFEINSPDLIPEPGSLAILAFGLAGLGFAGRRKRMI